MSMLLVSPLDFTASSTDTSGGTLSWLGNDYPGLTWRGAVSGSITIDLGTDPQTYDVVALIGTNLRSTDTVRIQTGTTSGTMNGYDSGTVPAWSGTKPKYLTAKAIFPLSTLRGERFIRITYSAPSHPDGYVEFQRLVIGKAVRTAGVDYGAKMIVEDRSVINSGAGFTSIDQYDRVPSWEFKSTGITDQAWREDWLPLILEVGNSRGVLFVRDHSAPSSFQTDAIFGRFASKADNEARGFDWWVFSATIQAFGR